MRGNGLKGFYEIYEAERQCQHGPHAPRVSPARRRARRITAWGLTWTCKGAASSRGPPKGWGLCFHADLGLYTQETLSFVEEAGDTEAGACRMDNLMRWHSVSPGQPPPDPTLAELLLLEAADSSAKA